MTSFSVDTTPFETPDGKFSAPVSYEDVSVYATGYTTKVVAVPKGTKDIGDVVLEAAEAMHGVVLEEGRPVAGATVRSSGFNEEPITDGNGQFTATLVEGGRGAFDVMAAKGSASGRVSVSSPKQSVTIALHAPTRVNGHVIGPEGKPVSATIFISGDQSITIDAAADGAFSIALPEGRWLFATRMNRATQVVDVQGTTMEVTLGVPPGSCGVTVQTPERPMSAWLVPNDVVVTDDMSDPPPRAVVLPAGVFTNGPMSAMGVPCGDYLLVASFRNGTTRTPVAVRSADLRLTLQPPPEPKPEEPVATGGAPVPVPRIDDPL